MGKEAEKQNWVLRLFHVKKRPIYLFLKYLELIYEKDTEEVKKSASGLLSPNIATTQNKSMGQTLSTYEQIWS